MKKVSTKIIAVIFCLVFIASNFLIVPPALAALELVRSKELNTIYYIDSHNVRHPFPNQATYRSWYGDDFSKVVTIPLATLATYSLGNNITIRSGTFLVKIQTAPQVYAVEQGGVLREIKDEQIAETLYGKNWAKRVVDVPDVFFQNYTLGHPITADYIVPDGILLQDKISQKYFYKNNGIVRLFGSTAAVVANHLKLNDAVVSSRSFTERTKPISGLDNTIFNPVAKAITDRRDCESKKLKAAVIFVADKDYTAAELSKVEQIKAKIAGQFSWATYDLSQIDLAYPTKVQLNDGYVLKKNNDGTTDVQNELISTFYDNNPDDFDFIFVWTNFKVPTEDTNEIAHFVPVTNRVEGLGKSLLDRSEVFGSAGKLKGIIMMGNINKYSSDNALGMNEVLNVAMHELLHNWSAYISFNLPDGTKSQDLLRYPDNQHWSYYDGFISPLGGSGWTDNGDGTFSSELAKMSDPNLRRYSQLDLYLMGLIPSQLMPEQMYVVPKNKNELNNTITGTAQHVTIDQIVSANGKVRCSID